MPGNASRSRKAKVAGRSAAPSLAGLALLLAACSSDAPAELSSTPSSVPGPLVADPGLPGSPGAGAAPAPLAAPAPPEDEAEPNATETNFFTAGCLSDADCDAGRVCQFPERSAPDAGATADAGADAGGRSAAPGLDLGSPVAPGSDAGADAADAAASAADARVEPEAPVRGLCVPS